MINLQGKNKITKQRLWHIQVGFQRVEGKEWVPWLMMKRNAPIKVNGSKIGLQKEQSHVKMADTWKENSLIAM